MPRGLRKIRDVIINHSNLAKFALTKMWLRCLMRVGYERRGSGASICDAAQPILAGSAREMADGEDSEQQQRAGSPSLTKTQVDIWSTDSVKARERFDYWHDAVCRAVFGITIEAPPERFAARIAARTSGSLRFAISQSTGYEIVRTARDIA